MTIPEALAILYPESPDGANSWYISQPELWIYPDVDADIYYQWDTSGGTWNIVNDVSPISGTQVPVTTGDRTLYYFASGNSIGTMKTERVMWDDTIPSGEFYSPQASGEYYPSGTYISGIFPIQASGGDEVSGIWQYVVRIDEQIATRLEYPQDTYFWDTKTSSDGIVKVGLEVFDKAGNSSSKDIEVIVGNTPAQIEAQPISSVVFGSGLDIYGRTYHGFIPIDRVEFYLFSGEAYEADWLPGEITATGESGWCDVNWHVYLSGLENDTVYTTKIRSWTMAQVTQDEDNMIKKTFTVKYLED